MRIELTYERFRIIKLSFYRRITANTFTMELLTELNKMRIKNSFGEEIDKLTENVIGLHHDGTNLSEEEKVNIMIETIKETAKLIANTNITAITLRRIYETKKKESIPHIVNYLMINSSSNKDKGTGIFTHFVKF